jgi:hypothetical protein
MPNQSFAANVVNDIPPASHAAVASTTAETNLWNPALWAYIPAFDPKPGKAYILRCGGIVSTTGTPTLQFTPRLGTSATPASNLTLGASTAVTLGSGISNRTWFAEFVLGFRQVGIAAAGATCTGSGFVVLDNGAGVAGLSIGMGSAVPTTADHTIAQGLVLSATWSASSASNTITCQWTNLQSLN